MLKTANQAVFYITPKNHFVSFPQNVTFNFHLVFSALLPSSQSNETGVVVVMVRF